MKHKQTETILAVKRITATVNSVEQRRMLMDLDISMRSSDCPFTVHFYGAMFREGDVWICMEVMDTSVDKFYARVFKNGRTVPEPVLGKIAFSVVSALHYLHTKLKVIHRDVKPSNILVNTKGEVKMCDFGISGYLVDSVAKTIDAGCKPYMAPERIDPTGNPANYDVRSDVWSFGISMMEIAEGKFPYKLWATPFEQLRQVKSDGLATGDNPCHIISKYAGGYGSCSNPHPWSILGVLQRLHLHLPEQEGGGPRLLLPAARARIPRLKQGGGSWRLHQGDP